MKKTITERHFMDINAHGLPEKYLDIKRTTYNDPEFDLPKVQATMGPLYLKDLLRNDGKASLSRDITWSCLWGQSLIPTASFSTTTAKRDIARAAAPCPARPTTSRTTVTRGRARRQEER